MEEKEAGAAGSSTPRDAKSDFVAILKEVADPATTNYDRGHARRLASSLGTSWHVSGSYTDKGGNQRDGASDAAAILKHVGDSSSGLQRDHAAFLLKAIDGSVSVSGTYT